jgi:hypothetical protein
MLEKEIEYVEVVDPDTDSSETEPSYSAAPNITVKKSNLEIQSIETIDEKNNLSVKARRAGNALSDLTTTAIDKAKDTISKKAKEAYATVATNSNMASIAAAAKDAKDISFLGPVVVEELARCFENEMTEITKLSYTEQTDLLTGFKKLLEEQIRVIDSKLHYVQRL